MSGLVFRAIAVRLFMVATPVALAAAFASPGLAASPRKTAQEKPGPQKAAPEPARKTEQAGKVEKQSDDDDDHDDDYNDHEKNKTHKRVINHTVDANSLLTFQLPEKNQRGNPFTDYSCLKDCPAGLSVDAKTGSVHWRPSYSQAGIFRPVMQYHRVKKGHKSKPRLQVHQIEVVAVAEPNRPPMLADIIPQTGTENQPLVFSLQASDPDQGDLLTYACVANCPPGLELNAQNGQVNWTPNFSQSGTLTVRFRVSDKANLISEKDVTLTINNANRAPEAFAASTAQTQVSVGGVVECQGQTNDLDGDALNYSYAWFSGAQASDSGSPVTGAESQRFNVTASQAHAFLRCEVTATDPQGLQSRSNASASLQVSNTAPNAFLASLPTADVSIGETLSCQATTSDIDGDALTYTTQWLARFKGESTFASIAPTSSVLSVDASLAHAELACRVTAIDIKGAETVSAQSSHARVANRAPQSFASSLEPGLTLVGGQLQCLANVTDPDGDSLTLAYSWFKSTHAEGSLQPIFGATGATLSVGEQDAHAVFQCSVSASDGESLTQGAASNLASVLNSAPAPFVAQVSASEVGMGDSLTCLGSTTDVDADELNYSVQWYAGLAGAAFDERIEGATHPSLSIDASLAHKQIRCEVTANDAFGGSTASGSSPRSVVRNSVPAPFFARVGVSSAAYGSTVMCEHGGPASDADGDALVYSFRWFALDAAGSPGVPVSSSLPFLTLGQGYEHALVQCEVVATDGIDSVSSLPSGAIVVQNAAPLIAHVNVTPAGDIVLGSTALCSVLASDVEGDSLSTALSWVTVDAAGNSAEISGAQSAELFISPALKHKSLQCVARVSDLFGGITQSHSAILNVANTVPVVSQASLNLEQVKVGDELTCSAQASDADGDAVVLGYQWMTQAQSGGNLRTLANESGSVLKISKDVAHQIVSCQVSAQDGSASVTSQKSLPAQVLNSAPRFSTNEAVLNVNEGQQLRVQLSAEDPDGDALQYTCSGCPGEFVASGALSWNVDHAQASRAVPQVVSNLIFQVDDAQGGQATSFAALTVRNTDRLPQTALQCPADAVAEDKGVTISFTASDADGDPVALKYKSGLPWEFNLQQASGFVWAGSYQFVKGGLAQKTSEVNFDVFYSDTNSFVKTISCPVTFNNTPVPPVARPAAASASMHANSLTPAGTCSYFGSSFPQNNVTELWAATFAPAYSLTPGADTNVRLGTVTSADCQVTLNTNGTIKLNNGAFRGRDRDLRCNPLSYSLVPRKCTGTYQVCNEDGCTSSTMSFAW